VTEKKDTQKDRQKGTQRDRYRDTERGREKNSITERWGGGQTEKC
jgi:hypothetical protein